MYNPYEVFDQSSLNPIQGRIGEGIGKGMRGE